MADAVAAAEKYAASGDLLAASRHYKQIVATYNELADTTAIRTKAEELGKSKLVQAAIKSERNMFEDQGRWNGEILGGLQTEENSDTPRSETDAKILQQVRDLRLRADEEKKQERSVVFKRALAGVFVGAIEAGGGALDKKEYRLAARYFSAAAEARPDAEWPLRQLAIAQVLAKDGKAAMETIHRIKPNDPVEFRNWLGNEPAFEQMRARGELKIGGVAR
jgi:hypothetical protein